jgi:hypothetical protein
MDVHGFMNRHSLPVPGTEWPGHSTVNVAGYFSFSPGHHLANVLA